MKKLKRKLESAIKFDGPVVAVTQSGFVCNNGINIEELCCGLSFNAQLANVKPRSRLVAKYRCDVERSHDFSGRTSKITRSRREISHCQKRPTSRLGCIFWLSES
ncbi:hypothetical protein RBSWK_05564 [Rhodopirellula baltica SWK14]|uniref:Uncharacterized protein n=1 Tax=Rhodopirellula baltica SWK14 TaxID=993516 RepID=L7C906_RHOBT|nr:hypothetical protein RBSWK_05564 [Rhodopirellula baltica SWK14]